MLKELYGAFLRFFCLVFVVACSRYDYGSDGTSNSFIDADNSIIGFGGGTHEGSAWSSNGLVIDSNTVSSNNNHLDSSWTPHYDDLVLYMKMDDAGFSDTTGRHNTFTIEGSITQDTSTKKIGSSSLYLVGTAPTTGFSINDNIDFDIEDTFAIQAWILSTGGTGERMVLGNHLAGSTNSGWYIQLDADNRPRFLGWNGDSVTGKPINNNEWYHIMVVANGNDLRLYVNGEYQATDPVLTSISSSFKLRIGDINEGTQSTSYNWQGYIDEIAIWKNVTLSPSEVLQIYLRQAAKYSAKFTSRTFNSESARLWSGLSWISTLPFGKELPSPSQAEDNTNYSELSSGLSTGLQGLYNLNEVSGSTTLNDASGNNNTATASNSSISGGNGRFSNGLKFDSSTTGTYVNLGSNFNYSNNFSWSLWVYPVPDNISTSHVLLTQEPNNPNGIPDGYYIGFIDRHLKYGRRVDSSTFENLSCSNILQIQKWNHLIFTLDASGTAKIYANGTLYCTLAITTVSPTGNLRISDSAAATSMYGRMDEVAIWNRTLSAPEVLQLYRRGANRVRFQTRTCIQADCSDNPSWQGPDGTNETAFSEIYNNLSNTRGATPSSEVLATFPSMLFSNFPSLSLPARQFFQYRAFLESDDSNAQCSGSFCSPNLKQVRVSP